MSAKPISVPVHLMKSASLVRTAICKSCGIESQVRDVYKVCDRCAREHLCKHVSGSKVTYCPKCGKRVVAWWEAMWRGFCRWFYKRRYMCLRVHCNPGAYTHRLKWYNPCEVCGSVHCRQATEKGLKITEISEEDRRRIKEAFNRDRNPVIFINPNCPPTDTRERKRYISKIGGRNEKPIGLRPMAPPPPPPIDFVYR